MAKVLVTGAGGYIGTTLVPMLLRQGFEVRAIDRYFFGKTLLPENRMIEIVKEDTRRLQLEHFAGIDHVIDLAAISNDPSGELFQKPTWEINESARIRAAQLAKQAGVKRYILPSSCSIYGFHEGDVVVNESSPTNPLTTYPMSPSAEIIREPPDCAPCMLRDCPIDHRCMTAISAPTVFAHATALMSRAREQVSG